jgi:GNAT superfamily N-acetyltransferase
MEIIKITPNNILLLEEFLKNEISPFFIYYQSRPINICLEKHLLTVVGLVDGKAVGYGHLDQADRCWLGICLLKEFQGKGFGKQLMNHLLNNFQGKELWLSVDSSNHIAIKLYLSFHFILKEIHQNKLRMVYTKPNDYLTLPVSYGESFDKLSILDIKLSKIQDERKSEVQKEYDSILSPIQLLMNNNVLFYYQKLKEINLSIWEKQDIFRFLSTSPSPSLSLEEKRGKDDDEKTKLCMEIIEENDRRFRLKNKINILLNSNLKEQKGYVKKKAFVLTHLGLGDHLTASGMVRYLSTKYDEVKVVCKNRNLRNLQLLYSDDSTISFYPVESDEYISPRFGFPEEKFRTIVDGYDVYRTGYHLKGSVEDIPLGFYDDVNIPREIFWQYSYIPDTPRSSELFDLVKLHQKYVVLHHRNSQGEVFNVDKALSRFNIDKNKTLVLSLNSNLYSDGHPFHEIAEIIHKESIIHYKDLICHADLIILADSSIFCMSLLLPIRTSECYCIGSDYSFIYKYRNTDPSFQKLLL